MDIDLSSFSAGRIYHLMTQTLLPRPIAWVLTDDGGGCLNLAPFSYFTAVSSAPPVLMFSVGTRPDGSPKDTRRNVEATGRFVVHIAHAGLLDAVNDTATAFAPETSEISALGLETTRPAGWPLPRVLGPRVAYSCALHRIDMLGPQALIFGRLEHVWLDDSVVGEDAKGRMTIRAQDIDPLARLGASEYTRLGAILKRRRKPAP